MWRWQSLLEQSKPADAEKYFAAALALEAPGEPGARARIGMAKLCISQNRYEDAMKALQSNTAGTFSREIQTELNNLNMQIAQSMNTQQDRQQQQEVDRQTQEQWEQYEQDQQRRIDEVNRRRQEQQKIRDQRLKEQKLRQQQQQEQYR